MAAISSAGIGSGIDVSSLINQIVDSESQATNLRLDRREFAIQTELSAVSTLKGAVSEFQSALSSLTDVNNFQGKFGSIQPADAIQLFKVTDVTKDANVNSHSVEVTTLADAHVIASSSYTDPNTVIGSGSLTFQFGTYESGPNTFTLNSEKPTKVVTIASGDNTLEGIRDSVNNANIGVTASIINDGSGHRLVFNSESTGLKNSLKITVTDDDTNHLDNAGLSELAYDPTATAGNGKNLAETVAAKDASIIVDGITITNESNTISDVITGVTISLLKSEPGTKGTVQISNAEGTINAKINSFIEAFNGLNATIKEMASYNPETEEAGVLNGDISIQMLEMQVRRIISDRIAGLDGGLRSLADVGITTQSDGALKLDHTTLDDALSNHFDDVAALFTAFGKPTDNNIQFIEHTDKTDVGNFPVNITQMASQGTLVGSVAANLTITQDVNDTLVVELDGSTQTIKLTAGTYTASALAGELQSRINGGSTFSSNDSTVKVTESAGVISITSSRYGSASKVDITGGNGEADLMGTPVQTDGLDVEGSINGAISAGSGRFLTGDGKASGLKIEITGGTTGDRGFINFTKGSGSLLDDMLTSFLDDDGPFSARTDRLNKQQEGITDDRAALQRRLESLESRLLSQFTAMDALVGQLKSTSSFLSQQLANLPGPKTSGGGQG
jgi:flagellar hook-associated protein 2